MSECVAGDGLLRSETLEASTQEPRRIINDVLKYSCVGICHVVLHVAASLE